MKQHDAALASVQRAYDEWEAKNKALGVTNAVAAAIGEAAVLQAGVNLGVGMVLLICKEHEE